MSFDGDVSMPNELIKAWCETRQTHDRDRLVVQYLPLVRRLCRKFANLGEPLEDLVQVGAIGLLKAIQKFDPERGNSLTAFAVPVVVGEIKNYFRDHGWAVKMPRKLQRQKLAVDRTVDALSQSLGRTPTIDEIARAADLSPEQVYEALEVERVGRPLSLDAEYERDDGEDTSRILDYLGQVDSDLENVAVRLDLQSAFSGVGPREQKIIYLKFCTGLSQTAIAARLGISQMHVSRLQRNALSKLKTNLLNKISAE